MNVMTKTSGSVISRAKSTQTAQAADTDFLYHWTSLSKAMTALKSDRLKARRWAHYLQVQDRMVKGSSWSFEKWRWSGESPICFVAQRSLLRNPIHHINGNRVFLQTKGILDLVYDPNAYKFESTDPDEAFVEGAVSPFSSVLASVLARHLRDEEFSALEEQGIACGVAVQQICDHQILGAPSARAPK
jgi:hypothetical protein